MNSTYSELLKQRSELDQKIEEARMQELDAALKQIRDLMDQEHGGPCAASERRLSRSIAIPQPAPPGPGAASLQRGLQAKTANPSQSPTRRKIKAWKGVASWQRQHSSTAIFLALDLWTTLERA